MKLQNKMGMKKKAYFLLGVYLHFICIGVRKMKVTQDITVSDHKRGHKLMNESKTSLRQYSPAWLPHVHKIGDA